MLSPKLRVGIQPRWIYLVAWGGILESFLVATAVAVLLSQFMSPSGRRLLGALMQPWGYHRPRRPSG
eukprot:297294-Pyramimonas_sp.AAC.1